jgi:hypothetical protein
MQLSWQAHVRMVVALALLTAACTGNDITSPRGSLRLLASISDTRIDAGETAIFTYTVRNVWRPSVRIEYAGCEPFPFIETEAGDLVYPFPGLQGPFYCFDPSPELITLAVGDERSRTVEIRRGEAVAVVGNVAVLVPGRYRAYAQGGIAIRGGPRVELQSPTVAFEVAP